MSGSSKLNISTGTGIFRECCGLKMKCIETRPTENGTRRRYVCKICGERKTTIELEASGGIGKGPLFQTELRALDALNHSQVKAIEAMIRAFR